MSERESCRCPQPPPRGKVCARCGGRSWRGVGSAATFEDARSADGPRLVAWLERHIGWPPDARFQQLMRRWRDGGHADFYSLDELLVHYGIHPSELPDDIWTTRARPRRQELVV